MEDTLRPLTESQIKQVNAMADNPEHAQAMIETNVEKQVQMAKMMFVAHLGQTNLVTDENEKVAMDRSVASMVSHCSRTAFVFPKGNEKEVDRMMGNLTGAKMGKGAGVYGRFAATHSTKHGATIGDFKEKKGVSLRHSMVWMWRSAVLEIRVLQAVEVFHRQSIWMEHVVTCICVWIKAEQTKQAAC